MKSLAIFLFFHLLLLTIGEFKLKLHTNDVEILNTILFCFAVYHFYSSLFLLLLFLLFFFFLIFITFVFASTSFSPLVYLMIVHAILLRSAFFITVTSLTAILKRWERYFDRPQNKRNIEKKNWNFFFSCHIKIWPKKWKWARINRKKEIKSILFWSIRIYCFACRPKPKNRKREKKFTILCVQRLWKLQS